MQLALSFSSADQSLIEPVSKQVSKLTGCPADFFSWLSSGQLSPAVSAAGGGEHDTSEQLSVSLNCPSSSSSWWLRPLCLTQEVYRAQGSAVTWPWLTQTLSGNYSAEVNIALNSDNASREAGWTTCPQEDHVSCLMQKTASDGMDSPSHPGVSSLPGKPTLCFTNHKALTNHFREVEGFIYLNKLTDLLLKISKWRPFLSHTVDKESKVSPDFKLVPRDAPENHTPHGQTKTKTKQEKS